MTEKSKAYKICQCKEGPLSPRLSGYYTETLVCNRCPVPIVVIDRYGDRHTIEPIYADTQIGHIEIVQRTIVGSRETEDILKTGPYRTVTGTHPVKGDTRRIKLDWFAIKNQPIYIEEIDVVLSSVEQADSATHPNSGINFDTALARAVEYIAHQENSPIIRFFANDPTGVVKTLYIAAVGGIMEVPVSSFTGNAATLAITMIQGSNKSYQHFFSFAAIKEAGGIAELASGVVYFVGMTRDQVHDAINMFKERDTCAIEDRVQSIVDMKIKAAEKEKEIIISEKEEIKKALEIEKRNRKLDAEAAACDIKDLTTQRDHWKSLIMAKSDSHSVSMKEREEAVKLRKAELGLKSEEMAMNGMIIKGLIGIGAILLGWWFGRRRSFC